MNYLFNDRYDGVKIFLLCNVPFLLHRLYKSLYPPVKIPLVTVLSATDEYIQRNKDRFLHTFLTNTRYDLNANVNQAFYSKDTYQAVITTDNNLLESEWKRRILFENTPRGNVIMYYDPYKLAFAYYCDTNSIPYNLINAVAMKYVLSFHCTHLFVDNEITPTDKSSPLINILMVDAPDKTKTKTKNKDSTSGIDMKNAPFAKFKKAAVQFNKNDDKNKQPATYNHNKFVCVGKIINFSFLNKVPTANRSGNGFQSKLLDNLAAETTLQMQVMSYKDFKNRSLG